MRTFVLGDIHGNIKALLDVIRLSGIDYEKDRLIFLGDVADGWDWVPECIDKFMKFKNFIWCLGNHDKWTASYFSAVQHTLNNLDDSAIRALDIEERPNWQGYWTGFERADATLWLSQGGQVTFDRYEQMRKDDFFKWCEHRDFWLDTPVMYHLEDNRFFVHGGLDWHYGIANQPHSFIYYWDRDLWNRAIGLEHMNAGNVQLVENAPQIFMRNSRSCRTYAKESGQTVINKVYIGHTVVDSRYNYIEQVKPQLKAGVWNLDTGAGSTGNACIMNVDTGKYHLSKLASEYYPGMVNAKTEYLKNKKKKNTNKEKVFSM